MLGKRVYFCDKADWKVKEGWAVTHYINPDGYGIYVVMDDRKKQYTVEEPLISESQALMEVKAIESKPHSDKIIAEAKRSKKIMDEEREIIIGKPIYKEIARNVLK